MKKKLIPFLFLVFSLFFVSYSFAAEVHFQWRNSSGVVEGYRIYYGSSAEGPYPNLLVQVGGTTTDCTATLDEGLTYYLVVRAYNDYGEGGDSNEVKWSSDKEDGNTIVLGDAFGSDYPGTCQDTYINAGTRSSNYSNSQTLNTYTWPTNTSANRVVMKWDLSAIPQNVTIHEAILSLNMYSASGDESYEVSAHKIVTNNPNISACTWNTYDGTHSWTGGANGGEQDLAPAESTAIVDNTPGYKNCSIALMVQQWVSNPSSNYGLMLDSDLTAASDSNRFFRPTEYSNPDQRPKLTVTYSDSSQITPPANLRVVP